MWYVPVAVPQEKKKDEAWHRSREGTENNDHGMIQRGPDFQNGPLLLNPSYLVPQPGLAKLAFYYNEKKGLDRKNGPRRGKHMDGMTCTRFFFPRKHILLEEMKRKGSPDFECLSAPTSIGISSPQTLNLHGTTVSWVFTIWILSLTNSKRFTDLPKAV